MRTSRHRLGFAALACATLVACGSTPPAAPLDAPYDEAPRSADPTLPAPAAFEQAQRERALGFVAQKRWAEAALAWEVLTVLRPDGADYRERLVDAQRQIAAGVAERMPRAAQAAQRGDIDAAAQLYLAVLALQPNHEAAADALRAIERERNKRNYLGKYSRITLTRRAIADAEMPSASARMSNRNELEHASLLAGDGEFDEAIGLLERRVGADRRDDQARRLLASVYYRKAESLVSRDKAGAIAALDKSARLDPADTRAAARLKLLRGTAPLPADAAASTAKAKPAR